MGSGCYTACSFQSYSNSMGRSVTSTGRVLNHQYTAVRLHPDMNPKDKVRECCNSDEHPNTIPVILALDVTGSMGEACNEVASTLSQIVGSLYKKFTDVEILIAGVGDFECDHYPLQVSQFESDVRIAKQLDNLYIEHGGGGNNYESYTSVWWFGLYRTNLDCYNKQGRKGIIITMGDEPLNPTLPKSMLDYVGDLKKKQKDYEFDTDKLYQLVKEKFEVFHISVDDPHSSYGDDEDVDKSFRDVIGDNYKISTIPNLKDTICDCIAQSIQNQSSNIVAYPAEEVISNGNIQRDENGGICW